MNRIKLGLSIIDSAIDYTGKMTGKGIKAVSKSFEHNTVKLTDDTGMDIIKISRQAKSKTITPEEFKRDYLKTTEDDLRIFPFEKDKVIQIAQRADGSYDKEILDCLFDIKKIGFKDEKRIDFAADMTEFLLNNGRIDKEMKQSLISFIKKTKAYDNLDGFFYFFNRFPENYNLETRKEILKFFHSVPEVLITGYDSGETMALIIKKYITSDLNKQDIQRKFSNLESMYKHLIYTENIDNASALSELKWDKVCQFIDSGLIPNFQICKYFDKHTGEVINSLKPLHEKGIKIIEVKDADTLNILISDKDSQIKRIIAAQPDNQYTHFSAGISPFDKNKCSLTLHNDRAGINILLDKNTQEIISAAKKERTNTGFSQRVQSLVNKGWQIQEYRWRENTCPQLKYERNILPDEEIFYTEASVPGQADVFRIKDGKPEVLSRGFRDPITGETVIKHHFTSRSGIKTNYRYLSKKDGSYELNYVIKDKTGKVLMRSQRRVETFGDNHFVHTINGKKYDVLIENNTIKITEQNGELSIIDLNKYIFEGENNEKILETLKRMPPDELLNFKNIKNPKFSLSKEDSQCIHSALDNFEHIEISNEDADKMFIYLHELGHLKCDILDSAALDNIRKVYTREVKLYKAKMCGYSIGSMDYLVDNTEHYLNRYNDSLGALEEAISDVNAQLKYPNSDRYLAERTVKFMEDFPETIAEISKYL